MILQNIKKAFQLLALATVLVLASCSNNEDGINLDTLSEISNEEAERIVLADDMSEEVGEVLEDDALDYDLAGKGTTVSSSVAPCVDRSKETTANGVIVTLDFGDGCTTRRGRTMTGKVIIEYTRTAEGYSKSVSFEDFSIDENKIEGSMSAERVKENANGNPESTATIDLTITLTTGEELTRKGTRVKEKIEGADTRERGDDVYSISGNWESTNKEGVVRKATITTNLIRKFACKYIVSGVVELSKGDATYTLDFGDGSCDNKATLTDSEGNTKEISLRKR
ncbi:hypothetical protein WH52_03070 [Tenacibaculum holothuriorum]|uniref:Lipoprotein n=1 Tax=Tenacibaculum holothuriorum TaxID=1635173 RepID=A0A1Y2PDW0_9FLAO|nr:hypothetical protein [Tenacibaculum holothuriorum]OSY88673.1 hypothetical protein WH52_03070 [Tenacibaculum holothuriorum]